MIVEVVLVVVGENFGGLLDGEVLAIGNIALRAIAALAGLVGV